MNRSISLNTPAADLLREAGEEAANLLSERTGLRVTRHAAMLAALRQGLATMLEVDLAVLADPPTPKRGRRGAASHAP